MGGGGGGRVSGGVSWCFSLGAAEASASVEGGTARERDIQTTYLALFHSYMLVVT